MKTAQIKRLNKKIDEILSNRKLPIFPIMAGISTDPSEPREPCREVTPEESEIAHTKGLPCPITIALSREQEFQEYLKS